MTHCVDLCATKLVTDVHRGPDAILAFGLLSRIVGLPGAVAAVLRACRDPHEMLGSHDSASLAATLVVLLLGEVHSLSARSRSVSHAPRSRARVHAMRRESRHREILMG